MTEMPFSVLFATTGAGIQRAERNGGRWTTERHLMTSDVRCLAASAEGVVFAGTQGDGLWRSDDGASWDRAALEGWIVKSIAVAAADPRVVYVGTKPPHIFRSTDGGTSFAESAAFRDVRGRSLWRQPAERPSTAYVQAVAVSATDPDIVVAGMEAGAVVRTTDGGRTWSNHLKGAVRDCHSLHAHPDGMHLYEGGGGALAPGFALSTDRGQSWTRPTEGLDLKYGWAVAADPADASVAFVSLSPGAMKAHSNDDARAAIFRRKDGAWKRLAGGLPQPLDHMPYALLVDRGSPGFVLAGLSNGELWSTPDGGDSWAPEEPSFDSIHRVLVGF